MRQATIVIPDDLAAQIDAFLAEHADEGDLSDLVHDALQAYLLTASQRDVSGFPPPTRPFHITPAEVGSGQRDISINHDWYLAHGWSERRAEGEGKPTNL